MQAKCLERGEKKAVGEMLVQKLRTPSGKEPSPGSSLRGGPSFIERKIGGALKNIRHPRNRYKREKTGAGLESNTLLREGTHLERINRLNAGEGEIGRKRWGTGHLWGL